MELYDIIFARVLMAAVLFEFFADGQQWDFHRAKAQYQKTAKVPIGYTRADMDRGFCTTGLWNYSRHPNFLAEQSIWVILYQWSCWATDGLYNWTAIGAISYLILFQASTWLTEGISSKKYPDYKEYQKRVGKFVPNLLNPWAWVEFVDEQDKKQKAK